MRIKSNSKVQNFIIKIWDLCGPIEKNDKALLFGIIKVQIGNLTFKNISVTKIEASYKKNYFNDFHRFLETERFNMRIKPNDFYTYKAFYLETFSDKIERLSFLYNSKWNNQFLEILLSYNNLKFTVL